MGPASCGLSLLDTRKTVGLGATLCAGTALAVAAAMGLKPDPRILYNSTLSAPHGFYWLQPVHDARPFKAGALVVYPVPARVAALVEARHYLPLSVPLLKPVTAVAREFVCTRDHRLVVRGQALGIVRTVDSFGRPLPVVEVCGRVPAGFFYSVSRSPQSFDSRYYGPVSESTVTATATPLWIW